MDNNNDFMIYRSRDKKEAIKLMTEAGAKDDSDVFFHGNIDDMSITYRVISDKNRSTEFTRICKDTIKPAIKFGDFKNETNR